MRREGKERGLKPHTQDCPHRDEEIIIVGQVIQRGWSIRIAGDEGAGVAGAEAFGVEAFGAEGAGVGEFGVVDVEEVAGAVVAGVVDPRQGVDVADPSSSKVESISQT
jgi:hypothetical protein